MNRARSVAAIAVLLLGYGYLAPAPVQSHSLKTDTTTATDGCQSLVLFPVPPAGFDPLVADDSSLEKYGFPPRPAAETDPSTVSQWADAMQHAIHYDPSEYGCPSPGGHFVGERHSFTTNYYGNWSGRTVPIADYSGLSFTGAAGEWTVPHVPDNNNFSDCGEPFTAFPPNAAVWVGLGGSAIIQSGTISCADGNARYRFWNEDFPDDPVFEGPAVHPGDTAYVYIQYGYDGANTCYYFEENMTTNSYQPYVHACTHHSPYGGGGNALFILERASGYYLPNFGSVLESENVFWNSINDWPLEAGATHNDLDIMTSTCDSSGATLAQPGSVSQRAFTNIYYQSSPVCN